MTKVEREAKRRGTLITENEFRGDGPCTFLTARHRPHRGVSALAADLITVAEEVGATVVKMEKPAGWLVVRLERWSCPRCSRKMAGAKCRSCGTPMPAAA